MNNSMINPSVVDLLEKVLLYAMDKEGLVDTSFDVIFVDNSYIHNLNKLYRGIDRETDVITFALEDDDLVLNGSDMRMLGDIYISIPRAKLQAEEYGHSFKRELAFLAVHGFYHLLGYDHQTKEDNTVTIRYRDDMRQERIALSDVKKIVLQSL